MQPNPNPPPAVLSIAGSDSGGGAGIQADLKTFEAFGVFGCTAITALTAQNTLGVEMAENASPAMVAAQIRAVRADFAIRAAKTGMLPSAACIAAAVGALEGADFPLVVDPVMLATSGATLAGGEAVEAMKAMLFPLAALITPNLPEAERLAGFAIRTEADAAGAAAAIQAWAPQAAVLLKGGHGSGPLAVDSLFYGGGVFYFSAPRLASRHTHGTGCTLSAAIAAGLALGRSLPDAVEEAKAYVSRAIAAAPGLGAGAGPLWHRV